MVKPALAYQIDGKKTVAELVVSQQEQIEKLFQVL